MTSIMEKGGGVVYITEIHRGKPMHNVAKTVYFHAIGVTSFSVNKIFFLIGGRKQYTQLTQGA